MLPLSFLGTISIQSTIFNLKKKLPTAHLAADYCYSKTHQLIKGSNLSNSTRPQSKFSAQPVKKTFHPRHYDPTIMPKQCSIKSIHSSVCFRLKHLFIFYLSRHEARKVVCIISRTSSTTSYLCWFVVCIHNEGFRWLGSGYAAAVAPYLHRPSASGRWIFLWGWSTCLKGNQRKARWKALSMEMSYTLEWHSNGFRVKFES